METLERVSKKQSTKNYVEVEYNLNSILEVIQTLWFEQKLHYKIGFWVKSGRSPEEAYSQNRDEVNVIFVITTTPNCNIPEYNPIEVAELRVSLTDYKWRLIKDTEWTKNVTEVMDKATQWITENPRNGYVLERSNHKGWKKIPKGYSKVSFEDITEGDNIIAHIEASRSRDKFSLYGKVSVKHDGAVSFEDYTTRPAFDHYGVTWYKEMVD